MWSGVRVVEAVSVWSLAKGVCVDGVGRATARREEGKRANRRLKQQEEHASLRARRPATTTGVEEKGDGGSRRGKRGATNREIEDGVEVGRGKTGRGRPTRTEAGNGT